MTFEGIGDDAYAYGWGMLLRYVGNVEVRNLGVMLFPDDGISMDTGNVNVWVHNNDIFYGTAGEMQIRQKGMAPQTSRKVQRLSPSLTITIGTLEKPLLLV